MKKALPMTVQHHCSNNTLKNKGIFVSWQAHANRTREVWAARRTMKSQWIRQQRWQQETGNAKDDAIAID
jgi:hypothetical protein